jgi:ATP-dependent Clp protease protease subunit
MRDNDREAEIPKSIISVSGRTIYFFGEVNHQSACEFYQVLDVLERKSKKPIEIILNSPGGNVYDGLNIYDRIRYSKCPIGILGTGLVASMALIIFLAGKIRMVTPNTILMNHQISSEVQGRYHDLKIELEEINRLEDLCLKILTERTGLSIKKIKTDIKKGDDYITPERAIKEGFAHEILEKR